MLSTKLVHAIRLHRESNWRLARRCGLHPTTLSRWLNGAESPKRDDRRLAQLAAAVGVTPDDCFEPEAATSAA